MEDNNHAVDKKPRAIVQHEVRTGGSDDSGSEMPAAHATSSAQVQGRSSRTVGIGHNSERFLRDFDDMVTTMDIPRYLKDHRTVLRFPEKVSNNFREYNT
jgi:hypothetical protein